MWCQRDRVCSLAVHETPTIAAHPVIAPAMAARRKGAPGRWAVCAVTAAALALTAALPGWARGADGDQVLLRVTACAAVCTAPTVVEVPSPGPGLIPPDPCRTVLSVIPPGPCSQYVEPIYDSLVSLIPPGPCTIVRPFTVRAPLDDGGSLTVEACPAARL